MPVQSFPSDGPRTTEDPLWGSLGEASSFSSSSSSWADCWFEGFGLDDVVSRHFERENKNKVKEYDEARTFERTDCSALYGDTNNKVGLGTGYLFAAPTSRKRKRYTASDWQAEIEDALDNEVERERRREGELLEDDPEYGAFDHAVCAGDTKVKQIKFLLDDLLRPRGWLREEAQKKLHRSYLIASLPLIYGKDWEIHCARVLKLFGVDDLKSLVLAIYARRFGKTISIANFVSPILIVMGGITISTFSTGRRASGNLMDECVKILSENPKLWARVITHNQEKLRIAEKARVGSNTLSPVNASTFNSYPSNPKGQFYDQLHIYIYAFIHRCLFQIPFQSSPVHVIKK